MARIYKRKRDRRNVVTSRRAVKGAFPSGEMVRRRRSIEGRRRKPQKSLSDPFLYWSLIPRRRKILQYVQYNNTSVERRKNIRSGGALAAQGAEKKEEKKTGVGMNHCLGGQWKWFSIKRRGRQLSTSGRRSITQRGSLFDGYTRAKKGKDQKEALGGTSIGCEDILCDRRREEGGKDDRGNEDQCPPLRVGKKRRQR